MKSVQWLWQVNVGTTGWDWLCQWNNLLLLIVPRRFIDCASGTICGHWLCRVVSLIVTTCSVKPWQTPLVWPIPNCAPLYQMVFFKLSSQKCSHVSFQFIGLPNHLPHTWQWWKLRQHITISSWEQFIGWMGYFQACNKQTFKGMAGAELHWPVYFIHIINPLNGISETLGRFDILLHTNDCRLLYQ